MFVASAFAQGAPAAGAGSADFFIQLIRGARPLSCGRLSTRIPTHLKRNIIVSRHVKIMAILVALPGRAEELRALLEGMTRLSRAEAGNLRYDLWQDRSDPNRFVIDELYADDEAVAAHRATPHFQNYVAVIGGLAERNALVLNPASVA